MSTLTFAILGSQHGKLITVQANIDGHTINFSNVNKGIYLKRSKTYQAPSKRQRLLSWLNNNGDYTKAPPAPKKTPTRQALRPAPKTTPIVLTNGDMVLEVEKQLLAKGFTLVKKGTTIPMSTCSHITKDKKGKIIEHGCGKNSMIGAFKELPTPKFIGVCHHRYNVASSCEVVRVWDEKAARSWLTKQKAA